MKKSIKWKAILMCMMMVVFYCLPMQNYYAAEGEENATISSATATITGQSGGMLQPGDSFSLNVRVDVSGFNGESKGGKALYFTDASVSGAVTNESTPYLKALGSDKVSRDGSYEFEITGLIYSGSGESVSAIIQMDYNDGMDGQSYSAVSNSYKLSAYDHEALADTLVVEKQDNIIVQTSETQNIAIKITNKGNMTINQADVTLALSEKVEGLTIKNKETQIKGIKSKEVKTATFTVTVDEDTKAGVYPAIVTVLGNVYSINLQVDSHIVPSALEVSLADKGIFTPGVEKVANFTVKNIGDRDAKNIRMELVNTENISVVENSNVKRLNIIQAKTEQTISMKVRINSDYKGESVAIPIKINYLSSTGAEAEDTQYVYLYTNSTTVPAEVTISNVVAPSGTFEVDENFTIKFNIMAKSATDNIQISVEGDEGIVPKSQNLFFENKLASGENKQYSVTFAATREAASSSHPIKVAVTYGKSDKPTTVNQYSSVMIKNTKKDKEDGETLKGKPKVIIGMYEIEPNIVRAGSNFVLTLGFLNTNDEHSVHNLKANILPVEQENKEEDTGNVFTPVDGSNTIYIADLMPGETSTKVLNMYTIPSATAKTYQITVKMAYEDEEGNEIEAEETLGIPVEQTTKLEIGDINIGMGMVGDPIDGTVTFFNRGKTKLNNMMVYIEGEGFTVEENKYFIGSFDIGESESYEPVIIAEQAGVLTADLVVEYEDASGQVIVEHKPFEIEVEEMMVEDEIMMNDEMMMDEQTEEKNHLPIFIGIGVGVVIAIVITIIVLKKRKAKKEEMMLDEED